MNLLRLRPDRYLNLVWAWSLNRVRENAEKAEEVQEWIRDMEQPLYNERAEAPDEADWDTDDGFMSAMAGLGRRG